MSNLKFKHLFKKKGMRMCFLIVCSLLISEKALAVYDRECCKVQGNTSYIKPKNDYITIFFKFFQYEQKQGVQNSYLKEFLVRYSKDKRNSYIQLASASTQNQKYKTWAWIDFKDKKPNKKIILYSFSSNQSNRETTLNWYNDTNLRFKVDNETNEAWCGIRWYPGKYLLNNVTHIQIKAIWYNHVKNRTEDVLLNYDITPVKSQLISKSLNFSDSSPKQVITNEAKSNTVNAYKNANLIVVKGALSEAIRVYTTTGNLVKSVVADSDVFQIPVPANQIYVVNVGQARYKVAL